MDAGASAEVVALPQAVIITDFVPMLSQTTGEMNYFKLVFSLPPISVASYFKLDFTSEMNLQANHPENIMCEFEAGFEESASCDAVANYINLVSPAASSSSFALYLYNIPNPRTTEPVHPISIQQLTSEGFQVSASTSCPSVRMQAVNNFQLLELRPIVEKRIG